MERFRLPLLVLDGLVAVIAATATLLWAVNVLTPQYLAMATDWIAPLGLWPRVAAVVVAVYLVLFNALFVSVNFLFSKYATHLEFSTAEGQVSIAIGAVEDSLVRSAREIHDVEDVRISVYKERQNPAKPVKVFASCTTWEDISLPELTEKIRAVLKSRMKDMADLPEAPIFDIHIAKIMERETPKEKSPSKKDAKKAAEMFHGPEYPVGMDN
ncbi:MAG: hypothetical protein K8T20_18905 [Planctomycetes bacterium]|nr:hypothetical protein [Planctomycetota bacterium]